MSAGRRMHYSPVIILTPRYCRHASDTVDPHLLFFFSVPRLHTESKYKVL